MSERITHFRDQTLTQLKYKVMMKRTMTRRGASVVTASKMRDIHDLINVVSYHIKNFVKVNS